MVDDPFEKRLGTLARLLIEGPPKPGPDTVTRHCEAPSTEHVTACGVQTQWAEAQGHKVEHSKEFLVRALFPESVGASLCYHCVEALTDVLVGWEVETRESREPLGLR